MRFGIDRLLEEPALRKPLAGRRVALLAHPASLTRQFVHALDALAALDDIELVAAFGPQHGLRGDKQDNMVESPNFRDPVHGIPVFSLYGEVRRPTAAMMDSFDVLLIDLQDLGCRIYTFSTTLRYVLEAASERGKAVWVLDRPNPIGRPVEGLRLRAGWESFVGAGPLPMRHGLTLGELAQWFVQTLRLDVEYHVVTMEGWEPARAPGFGWPLGERNWVNPRPVSGWPAATPAPSCWKGPLCPRAVARPARWRCSARQTLSRAPCWRRCSRSRRTGCRAAGCASVGSRPRSTSMRAHRAQDYRSMSRMRPTITTPSARGA